MRRLEMSRRFLRFFLLPRTGVSRVHRRVIRRYFHGIGFPHLFVFVAVLYHIPKAKGEEMMNKQGKISYDFVDIAQTISRKAVTISSFSDGM